MEELFVPYMEGTRYLDKEGKSLTELYAGRLIRFTNWHVRRFWLPLSLPPSVCVDALERGFAVVEEIDPEKLTRRWCSPLQRAMNKAKPSNTLFDRMVNQLSSAAHQASLTSSLSSSHDPSSSPSTSTAPAPHADPSRLDRLMKFSGLSNITASASAHGSPALNSSGNGGEGGGGEGGGPEAMYEEGDGELSVETAEKMLEWHAEAVGRMVELSPASDV